ncbi:MAG: transcription termination/antitermination protein NusG [Lacipirellulaceae bacterium]
MSDEPRQSEGTLAEQSAAEASPATAIAEVAPPTAEELAAAAEQERADEELVAAEALVDDTPIKLAPRGPIEEVVEDEEQIQLDWYILKVQSNRERTATVALQRKVAIEGLGKMFGEIVVPTEKVTEFKNGKKKVVDRKIWPGYIAVQMHVNDETRFAVRETSGIGDFTGASGKPTPMSEADVRKIKPAEEEQGVDETPKLNIRFVVGDKIKVNDGNFENFEGEVHTIDQASGKVTIMISIFGRSTPVELEYWQVEVI